MFIYLLTYLKATVLEQKDIYQGRGRERERKTEKDRDFVVDYDNTDKQKYLTYLLK